MKPDNWVATGPDFQPFHRALRDACLRGQLGLRKIAVQPDFGQPTTQFTENHRIRGLFAYFHNTSFMAN
jgi:hypothetical protein